MLSCGKNTELCVQWPQQKRKDRIVRVVFQPVTARFLLAMFPSELLPCVINKNMLRQMGWRISISFHVTYVTFACLFWVLFLFLLVKVSPAELSLVLFALDPQASKWKCQLQITHYLHQPPSWLKCPCFCLHSSSAFTSIYINKRRYFTKVVCGMVNFLQQFMTSSQKWSSIWVKQDQTDGTLYEQIGPRMVDLYLQ